MRPEYRDQERWICANVLAAVGVIWLEARLRVFRRAGTLEMRKSGRTLPFPRAVRRNLRRALAAGVYLRLLAPVAP